MNVVIVTCTLYNSIYVENYSLYLLYNVMVFELKFLKLDLQNHWFLPGSLCVETVQRT